uniref:2-(3-amino-3-carboxypropyl)histidine synthase subunit 2 n=1 Tax=Albugo laibachii Nc14 TaxID=890382 RepID=F0WR36_9STRA|nr:diphthamide biosynthesis protein putative [Albugo laibachii Nc14]|eukprot:CCA23796.1 diphthamide biosynthesis protein putative [Albugo laibachii Nc14]
MSHVSLAFESDDIVAVKRIQIEKSDGTRDDDSSIDSFYDRNRCIDIIKSHNYKKIALQLPDSLLRDAVQIQRLLQERLRAVEYAFDRVFVLGDTSYGSCCVDEIAATHLQADCVIHYGRSCLSATSSLPVIFVFGNQPIDKEHSIRSFSRHLEDKVEALCDGSDIAHTLMLLYDPFYAHAIESISSGLSKNVQALRMTVLTGQTRRFYDPAQPERGEQVIDGKLIWIGGQSISLPEDCCLDDTTQQKNYAILYIGSESQHLTSILMRFSAIPCISYDPKAKSLREEGVKVNKLLMRRYFLMQKAKEARIFGVLMGTLGVTQYQDIVKKLRDLITRSGRKSYLFVVGKVNVHKLANFSGIDAFVLVACRQNTLLDSKEFYKPIITPYELIIALSDGMESWNANYKSDFRDVLPLFPTVDAWASVEKSSDEPFYSLISGTYTANPRTLDTFQASCDIDSSEEGTLVRCQRGDLEKYRSQAGEYLSKQEYQGLDPRIGKSQAHAAVTGTSGIARGYAHEPE